MWYCTKCGTENEGRFCSVCGTEHDEYSAYAFEDEPYEAAPKQKSKKGALIAIIAVAALLIVGALVGILVLNGGDKGEAVSGEGTGILYYVSSADGSTSLYDDHNIESAVLANLKNGTPVEFISAENDVFYYVTDRSSNLTGYVLAKDLVDSLDDVIGEEVEDISAISLGEYYVTGVDDKIGLTDAPGGGKTVVNVCNGYQVALIEETSSTYWYVFDYKSGEYGYIKKGYLTDDPSKVTSGAAVDVKPAVPADKTILSHYMVDGTKNYLAIRSTPSSSSTVEIGKTYNGNIVGLIEKTNSTFWYVYDYNSGIYGYVKCAYLVYHADAIYDSYVDSDVDGGLAEGIYCVSETKNYLAIRSEPKDTADVEIGKTYNGNLVEVIEYYNDTYWYIYDYESGLYGYVKCKYLSK